MWWSPFGGAGFRALYVMTSVGRGRAFQLDQVSTMRRCFYSAPPHSHHPDMDTRRQIARTLRLTLRQVTTWYSNERQEQQKPKQNRQSTAIGLPQARASIPLAATQAHAQTLQNLQGMLRTPLMMSSTKALEPSAAAVVSNPLSVTSQAASTPFFNKNIFY